MASRVTREENRKTNKKKTTEEFRNEIIERYSEEYSVLGEYINAKTNIKMKHNTDVCGYEWEAVPNHLLRKRKTNVLCPKCNHSARKDINDYKREIDEKYNGEYTILGEYESTNKHILTRHNSNHCNNHEWLVTPSNLLRGFGCPACRGRKIAEKTTMTHSDFLDKVYKVHGDNYKILSEYKGNKEHIKVLHVECGYEYMTPPSVISKGHGCPSCAGIVKKTTESYSKELEVRTSGEFKLMSEYVNAHTYVTIKHDTKDCGGTFRNTPNKLTYSINCPHCSMWGGEQIVLGFLKKYNLNYIPQYRFEDCRNVYPLPFDFAVFNKDDSLNCLIEFDGLQHEQPVEWFGGEEQYEIQKMRDTIKNNYCKQNKLKLIRIPYREFKNIHLILEKELKDLL